MDIKQNYDDNNKSTSSNLSFESNIENINKFNSISNESDLLIEQFRLEHEIADRVSIKTQDSFITTYSTLEMIFSQMEIKLVSVLLEETEYLKQCDTIEQIKTKLNCYLNSNEDIDLFISSKTKSYFCSHQIPTIKQCLINSTILCQKKISSTRSQNYLYHLIMEIN